MDEKYTLISYKDLGINKHDVDIRYNDMMFNYTNFHIKNVRHADMLTYKGIGICYIVSSPSSIKVTDNGIIYDALIYSRDIKRIIKEKIQVIDSKILRALLSRLEN